MLMYQKVRHFLPVINSVNINVPNVCGQGPDNLSVRDLRKASAAFVSGAVNLSVAFGSNIVRFSTGPLIIRQLERQLC